jgi:hypothetical protein
MALLDGVFSGEESVTATLAELLAGDAMVICPGELGAYDKETDKYERTEPVEYAVKFIQDTKKQNVWSSVGGIQVEAGDLVGLIPAYQIKQPIRRQVDRLERNGINYIIHSTEEISSGNETALVRVLCKKT